MKRPIVLASAQSDGSDSGSASAGGRAAGACSTAMTQAVTQPQLLTQVELPSAQCMQRLLQTWWSLRRGKTSLDGKAGRDRL